MPVETIPVRSVAYDVDTDATGGVLRFWDWVKEDQWERETFDALGVLLEPDSLFVDVGAWIGPFSLFAAARGAAVLAFEPDPTALAALRGNLARNPDIAGQITLIEAAAACWDGELTLYSRSLGNSETSVFQNHERGGRVLHCEASFTAPQRDIRPIIERFRRPGGKVVVKVDIEGGEYLLLPGLAPYLLSIGATLVVSTHPFNLVGTDPADTLLRRYRSKLAVFDDLRGFQWMNVRDGRLQPADGAAVIRAALDAPASADFLVAVA